MDTNAQRHAHIFISYSHKDAKHLERLQVHLKLYQMLGIDTWDDTRIQTGQQWRVEIRHALSAAKVAILLVSADFLASNFITENELPPLLAAARTSGTRILSVIVGACNFSETLLEPFQAVNSPSNPLNNMSWPKREEIWTRVAKVAADILSGPLYTKRVKHVEADLSAEILGNHDTVLGDEIDTLIALQLTLKNAPKDVRFPYFARPLGPLIASSESNLRKAQEIRRHVLRMVFDAAHADLAPDDKASDRYYGYLSLIMYLRSVIVADDWMRFEEARDVTDVIIATLEELTPLVSNIPKTEAECYEQEQIAVAQIRYDMARLGVRAVPAFSAVKEELFGE